MDIQILNGILRQMLEFGTPVLLASLGGVISENSGVVNIALEGMMRFGAFFAALISYKTGNPFIGIIAGMVIGAIVSLLHAFLSITWKANQIISGVAINIVSLGMITFLLEYFFKTTGHSPSVPYFGSYKISLPFLANIPVVGALHNQTIFIYLALILPFALHFFLYKTVLGLRIRSVGEHPHAADSLGINVYKIRYLAVILSGVLAGLAGASLSIGYLGIFEDNMPAGKGFIALAAMIFGKWKPIGALLAVLFFSLGNVIQTALQIMFPELVKYIPVGFFLSFPYFMTILILVGFVGRAISPAADGIPFEKESEA